MSISINQHRVVSIDLDCDNDWIELSAKDEDGNTLDITFFTRTIADDSDNKKIELLHDLASQIRRALRDE